MRCREISFRAFLLAAAVLCNAALGHASLITIHPTFDATITRDPNAAAIESTINSAINYYDTTFTTGFSPLTVNITFAEGGGLGSSLTTVYSVPYASFISALHAASAGNATDTAALAGLPVTATTNPVNGSASIDLKSANCRALGMACTLASDGTITLNTAITSPPGSSGPNAYSLLAVTEHEIDEVLGLGSDANNTGNPFFNDPMPEDLFRYGLSGARVYNTPAGFDGAYFSLDGRTFLVLFNNLANGGDYGDWWSGPGTNSPPRVQDAFGTSGSNPTLATDLGTPEIIALDALGYNLAPVATPEPTTMLLTGSGLLLAALLARRRAVGSLPRRD